MGKQINPQVATAIIVVIAVVIIGIFVWRLRSPSYAGTSTPAQTQQMQNMFKQNGGHLPGTMLPPGGWIPKH